MAAPDLQPSHSVTGDSNHNTRQLFPSACMAWSHGRKIEEDGSLAQTASEPGPNLNEKLRGSGACSLPDSRRASTSKVRSRRLRAHVSSVPTRRPLSSQRESWEGHVVPRLAGSQRWQQTSNTRRKMIHVR